MANRVTVAGSNIDMGEAKVSMRRTNPMFEAVGSYSLPFRIPRTSNNERIFKLSHPAIHAGTHRFDAIIHIGPVPINGELVISEISDQYFETYFTTGNSTFRSKVSNVKLNELNYTEAIPGSAVLSFTDALDSAADSSFPTYNYTCFPMLAPNYYNEDPFTYNAMINPWSYHPTDPSLEGFYPTTDRNLDKLYAPSFYLCFVIQKIFDLYGYTIDVNEIYDDTELRTLVIPNFNTQGKVDTTFRQYDLTFKDALPGITIAEFIEAIENMFDVTFFIRDESRLVNIRKRTAIVKSTAAKSLKLLSRLMEPEKSLDGFSLSYTMDSEDSFSKITNVSKYTLGLTVDNKSDLSSYSAGSYKGQLAYISNNDFYYISRIADASTDTWEWFEVTKDFFNHTEDGGELQMNTTANPVLTDNDIIYCYYGASLEEHAIFPKIGGLSCINANGIQEYNTFNTLRLLFYRGIVTGGGSIINPANVQSEYPLASPDVYRAHGLTSPARYGRAKIPSANMSLRWGGTYGLYETHWKDYLYWYINLRKAATDQYDLSLAEIFSINFWEKYRAGDVSVLFRSIELEIDFVNDSVRAGKCEVYIS